MKKPFDIGIYVYHRIFRGDMCPSDDTQMKEGSIVAVLHPMNNVDPSGLYCFGVDKDSRNTKTLVRKNLRFKRVVTSNYEQEPGMEYAQEIQAKLNVALAYLITLEGKQMEIAA